MFKKIFIFISCVICFMVHVTWVNAQDYKADYQVEYFLKENQRSLSTNVKFNIQITNLVSDLYVTRFSILFPKSFSIKNIVGYDDSGAIEPKVEENNEGIKIDLQFKDPKIGKNSINNFYLQFDQDNLFSVHGNIWEVILPTVENKGNSTYKILVNLPDQSDKKISLSKPKPDFITGKQIIWNNPKERTIYAVFGDKQQYELDLNYHIYNPKLFPVFTEIALIPDTLYQKTFIKSISQSPVSVRQDEDGNLLAKYYLNPKETKTITYSGLVEIFTQPRMEVKSYEKQLIQSQTKYLLSESNFWTVDETAISKVNDIRSIYDYTVLNLRYDYNKLGTKKERLGAKQALLTPENAVCVEFSDVFIALAREKGFLSREIQGYGFSQDSRLRPLSLNSDILHSWPQYFDKSLEMWVSVDPTWEHTSGIDYFHSLDLNHITFVIHGQKPDYPLPAGMYKVQNSRDVLVKPISKNIVEKTDLEVKIKDFPKEITDNKSVKTTIIVTNLGNIYQWKVPIKIETKNLETDKKYVEISSLAPYEKYETEVEIKSKLPTSPRLRGASKGELVITSNKITISKVIEIIPYYYSLVMKLFVVTLVLGIPIICIFIIKKLRDMKGYED